MAKNSAAPKKLKPGVTIRMYCQGLGDCFLLTFPSAKEKEPVRVLIDCGVLQHTPGEAKKMNAVVDHLAKETRSIIDLLIVTHEHWDHVAGFSHAKNVFEKFTFKNVWLSWAENPEDPVARQVKDDLGKKKKKVAALAALADAKIDAMAAAGNPFAAQARKDIHATTDVLRFLGIAPLPAAAADETKKKKKAPDANDKNMSLGDTMDWLRAKVPHNDFRMPGERLPLPGADGVNVYVLGPPRDTAAIRKMDPTGDQGYRLRADRVSQFAALDRLLAEEPAAPESPVDEQYRIGRAEAEADPFFRQFYGFSSDPLGDQQNAWRRIDDDWWLSSVSQLALQLDRGVNNTSLALCFELPDRRTLIFPGDVQIGNWMSWDAVKFKDEKGKKLKVTAKELLNRAVFYKVGHHGSHNATRRVGGLEEMTGNLVAMIPTDEAFANKQSPPHGWKMPFAVLYDALKTRTSRRILRADKNQDDLKQEEETGRADSSRRWDEFDPQVVFASATVPKDPKEIDKKPQPLYIEYTIPL